MPESPPVVVRVTLYGTSACHLCEVAEQLLQLLCEARPGLEVIQVDIAESDELVERYGERIPVLGGPQGRELDWPFTPEQLWAFCSPGD